MEIEARGIGVAPGGARLLEDVNLRLRPGELLGLVGPNGAGKSTLLRVLAGLRPPDAGSLLYDGRPAAALSRGELARRLAYLAQGGEAHWPLRVARLVALGRLPHQGLRRRESAADRAAVERALARVGVAGLAGRTLAGLSGGERRLVLLARALAVEAEFLLADEPVAALDPHHQLRVMELLRAEAERGRGVVAVLHELPLALRFCHRLALLHRGRLLAVGPPAAVLGDAGLASAYAVTAVRGEREGEAFLLPWRRLPQEEEERK